MTRNKFIIDNSPIILSGLFNNPDVKKGEHIDLAIRSAEKLYSELAERGYMKRRTNSKKDYYEALTEKQKEWFNKFWDAFNYKGKCSKKGAVKAFYDIKNADDCKYEKLVYAATLEAKNRDNLIAQGRVPIHAQGWINGDRWSECEVPSKKEGVNTVLREAYQELAHFKRMKQDKFTESEINKIELKIKSLEK